MGYGESFAIQRDLSVMPNTESIFEFNSNDINNILSNNTCGDQDEVSLRGAGASTNRVIVIVTQWTVPWTIIGIS